MNTLVPINLLLFGSTLIPWQDTSSQVARGMVSAQMRVETSNEEIAWKDWSKDAFDEARRRGRLVLLDLSAGWCHWCHVMDRTTYSDPEVVETVNREFVPVRVDIDARPDISERYNRGGFPTTAFLSDRGESIWGATYVPPKEMKRILRGILSARASGEIAKALEKSRRTTSEVNGMPAHNRLADRELVDAIFEDVIATYDEEHGGFGLYPKFPHPEVLNMLLLRHLKTGDSLAAKVVRHTISSITKGLYDEVEGGLFRYSVTRDWSKPHYEKMLETNVGFLRTLAAAYQVFRDPEYDKTASGIAGYVLDNLLDKQSGGFRGSQDADEEYYSLPAEGRAKRSKPLVIPSVYAGWNAEAVSALVQAGLVFKKKTWLDAAIGGWNYSTSHLWNEDLGLLRHDESSNLYLFEDQVSFLEALLSVYSITGRSELLEKGLRLVSAIERNFSHPRGGYADILQQEDAIGELGERMRPLVSNSRYARFLALLSASSHDDALVEMPRRILSSFAQNELESHGLFAADFVIAWHVLEDGPRIASIGLKEGEDLMSNGFWDAARLVHNPSVLSVVDAAGPNRITGATICSATECSEVILDPQDFRGRIEVKGANQI